MVRYTKRTYKRKARKTRSTPRYRNLKAVVPDKHVVKLRYVQQFDLDASSLINNSRVFRANSIFDPDFTGVGHQPLGHDQWAVFYDHYNVVGSKITAKFISTSAASNIGASVVGILLRDSSTLVPVPTDIMEQTNSGYGIMTNSGATQVKTIVKGFSCKKFFGLKDIADNRAMVGAAFGSNPSEDAYFHVYQAPLVTGEDPTLCHCIVTMEFMVQLTERKVLPQS